MDYDGNLELFWIFGRDLDPAQRPQWWRSPSLLFFRHGEDV
jgi:hypothetical protein